MTMDSSTPIGGIGCRLGLGLGALAALATAPARAQEYCVSCSEPAGLYRCVIEGAQPRGGQSLQMLCVTAMAKEGGHATCSVKRGTIFDCDATVKRIPWAAIESAPPVDTAQPPLAPAAQPPAQPAAAPIGPAPDAPPQTMVDLAKQANEKTAEQMKKAADSMKQAGESVKQATKKTWDCVLSLFTRCGE
jgi:hypothetical protein